MKTRSRYSDPSTRNARSGFRLAAQTPPKRLNLKLATRNSKLRIVQLLLVGLLIIACVGAGDDARFNKLGHGLMCMCGCNQVLLECNHVGCTYSERMRNELIAGIERGDSDSLVLQSFVQKYGNTVLSAPTTTGFNRVAWIMPFAVFAAALALTILLVRLWKSRTIAHPVPPPNLDAAELDELRKKARQETDY
ncbi:MAG: cytochrome c-type biogenesis protein CcmH [Candidatus Korobacteraceae bacterium]